MISQRLGRHLPALLLLIGALVGGFGAAAQEGNVSDVRLEGLERVSEQLIRSQLEVQTGQPYNDRAVTRDVRRLYDLGFFRTIEVDASPGAAGLTLTYRFEEKQVIDTVRIIGNDGVRERDIRAALDWREGDSFVADAYTDEREAIVALYQSKGYPNAAVDFSVESAGPARVQVTAAISEGEKARIAAIDFAGNEALTAGRLRRTMLTKARWWFFGGKYDELQFEMDLDRLLDEYGDVGRLEAAITRTDFNYSESGSSVDILIHIDEGPEYTVGAMDIAENVVFDDDEILGIIAVQPGDVHDRGQVLADADLVQKGYEDSGYIDASVRPQVTLDRETHTTNVTYLVDESSMRYVREIEITGNDVTKDEVVRRQMAVTPGERFDGSKLRFSEQRLDSLDYFDAIRFSTRPSPDDDRWADLLVDVEESNTGNFSFGGTFSTDSGLGGFTQIQLRNFDVTNYPSFSGGGQNLTARISLGERSDEFFFGFSDPEFMGAPLAAGFDIYNESVDHRGSDFEQEQRGVNFRIGKILSPYVRTRAAISLADTDISGVPRFAQRELRKLFEDDGSTYKLIWGIDRDTRDNSRNPISGYITDLNLELAGFGSDHEFYKIELDTSVYRKLDDEAIWVASLRTRQGWVNNYGSSEFVSLSDRFYAGGGTTIRGFDTREVGPKLRQFRFWGEEFRVGGELRLLNSAELRYELNDIVRLYTFADMGGVWPEADDFDFGGFKYSVGLGVGLDVPRLGPIRVDYAIPLNADDDQGSGRLHLRQDFSFR